MKNFIKDNWFRLTIILVILIFSVSIVYYLFVFIPNKEKKLLARQSEEKILLAVEQEKRELNDPKSDKFIVTYDKDGKPLNWETLTRVSLILKDTLDTYESALPEIQNTQAVEKENLTKIYSIINNPYLENKSKWQKMITYDEAYIASGEKVVVLLMDLITNYSGLRNAVEIRDPALYLYYYDEISLLEANKSEIMKNYSENEAAKMNFAKTLF